MGQIWQGKEDEYELIKECQIDLKYPHHDQIAIDAAYDLWDKYYGEGTFDYEVYVLQDGSKTGKYEYGPLKFNYEPFYVGHGEMGRAKKSASFGRQLDKYTNKVLKMIEIRDKGACIRWNIINRFKTKNKAIVVEKKLLNLIPRPPLTNSLYHPCEIPLMEEDYLAMEMSGNILTI